MSQENVEIVRSAFDALNRDGLSALDRAHEIFASDVEVPVQRPHVLALKRDGLQDHEGVMLGYGRPVGLGALDDRRPRVRPLALQGAIQNEILRDALNGRVVAAQPLALVEADGLPATSADPDIQQM